MTIVREGLCKLAIFFYPSGDSNSMMDAQVTLYDNGLIHLKTDFEDIHSHIHNCELIWDFKSREPDPTDREPQDNVVTPFRRPKK